MARPYEKSGLKTGVIKNPGKHTGSAGLTMGTGDGENPSPIQDLSPQPFGARCIGKPLIQHSLHNRLPRDKALPTNTRSGAGRADRRHIHLLTQCRTLIIGCSLGVNIRSDPVTEKPDFPASKATPPMKVLQIPKI